jgi:hypothetical protein
MVPLANARDAIMIAMGRSQEKAVKVAIQGGDVA